MAESLAIDDVLAMGRRARRGIPRAGLKLWLDATRLALADAAAVATWADASGQGNDASQGTGAAQPTFRTGITNGRPGVLADGVDDFMTLTAGARTALLAGDKTVFVVVKYVAFSTDARIITIANGAASARFCLRVLNASPIWGSIYTTGIAAANLNTAVVPSAGAQTLLEFWQGGASIAFSINNGTASTAADAGTEAAGAGSALFASSSGAAAFANAYLHEVLVYDRALTTAERAKVRSYLAAKWSLTLA